jgi:predicted lipid-binding transport protein (Tim44 family)
MGEDNWLIEIVVLAMLAGFIALRLVSVLGRRTGHEEPAGDLVRRSPAEALPPMQTAGDARQPTALELPEGTPPRLRESLVRIAAADPMFDPVHFVEGATAAYRMILEAFWNSDEAALKNLVSDDIAAEFGNAIEARKEEGLTLDNRIVGIERAEIVNAEMRGAMAEVTVRFDADLVALTRDKDGNVVAGSTSDAVQTHDVWTFSRHTGSPDPNWLLIETDEEA